MSRLLPEAAYRRLKAATALALRATPEGSAEGFAARTRVSERSLRFYADHSSELFAPLDIVADIEAATADPIFARVLADLSGCVLAPKHADPTAAALTALKQTAAAGAHIAVLVADKSTAHADWTREASKALLADVRRALEALTALEAVLKLKTEGKS